MAVVLKPTPRLVLNSLNRAENREMVLFGDAIKNLAYFLPQAYLAATTASPEQLAVDHDSLYFEMNAGLVQWSKVVLSPNGPVFKCHLNYRLNLVQYSDPHLNTRTVA